MSDRVLVPCPGCATDLRVPAASVGTTILCPVCRRPVAVPRDAPPADPPAPEPPPAPPPAEPPPAPVVSESPPAEGPPATEAPPPAPVESASAVAPAAVPGRKRLPLSTGIGLTVAAAVGLGIFLAMRPAVRGEIPEAAWKAVEVPGLFRAKLPGTPRPEPKRDPETGLLTFGVSPDKDSAYEVGFMEEALPLAQLGGKVDPLVDQLAELLSKDVVGAGGKELKRAKLTRPHPGREVVLQLPRERGRVVQRVLLVRGRVFVLTAAGPDLDADHPNVARLFRSFEPLEGAAGALPPPDEP